MTAELVRAPNQHFVDEDARDEDVRWMHEHGESAIKAAERLGITPGAFNKWCNRRQAERPESNMMAVWQAMADRNPARLNVNQYDPARKVR